MGIREVRRLRGEFGRAIFRSEAEGKFKALFGEVKPGTAEMPCVNDGELEGDLLWPTDLLLSTAEQARTGKPPVSGLRYRGGRSGGGFDRLRFAFESQEEMENAVFPDEDETGVDLTLALNRRDCFPAADHPAPPLVRRWDVLWFDQPEHNVIPGRCREDLAFLHLHR